MEVWEKTMLRSLQGCHGVPTLMLDSTAHGLTDTLSSLQDGLTRVGVRGLTMPSSEEVEEKVGIYFRPPAGTESGSSSDAGRRLHAIGSSAAAGRSKQGEDDAGDETYEERELNTDEDYQADDDDEPLELMPEVTAAQVRRAVKYKRIFA
jgi:hypothetical protein